MKSIQEKLYSLQDKKYQEMQFKIIPNIPNETIIGVRTPDIRKLAKEMIKGDYEPFLKELPHTYFDENQLHGFILNEIKDYEDCLDHVNQFLPYVDNWATCDTLSPKVFDKHPDALLKSIQKWIHSKKPYTIRFGIGMLMKNYLNDFFKVEYLDWVSSICSDEYYVNMMIAWYIATALAKQYDFAIKVIENHQLDTWTHNKAIQKAIESYRITPEHKEYLRALKRK